MADYQLVIKIPFVAMDDIAARNVSKVMIEKIDLSIENVKLQRTYLDKPPEGVSFIN